MDKRDKEDEGASYAATTTTMDVEYELYYFHNEEEGWGWGGPRRTRDMATGIKTKTAVGDVTSQVGSG